MKKIILLVFFLFPIVSTAQGQQWGWFQPKTFTRNGTSYISKLNIGTYEGSKTATGTAPSAPTLQAPANNAIGIDASADHTFSWTAVSGATGYQLQISLTSDFSMIVYDQDEGNQTSGLITGCTFDGGNLQYWWRTRARNGNGYGTWSSSFTFTTTAFICG